MSLLWRPLLVLFAFVAIVVVILVLLFSGGGDDGAADGDDAPVVATPDVEPEELDVQPKNPDAEPVSAKDLEVGDCIAEAKTTTGDVTAFDRIDCDKPHDGEVFTLIELEGDRYPGTKFVSAKGQRGCRARLRRQAAREEFADRQLGYKFVYPTAQSWAQGDHEITCIATFNKPRTTKLEQRAAAS